MASVEDLTRDSGMGKDPVVTVQYLTFMFGPSLVQTKLLFTLINIRSLFLIHPKIN